MAYLDNTSVTVDAVLTKRGREIISAGGSLNVTQFTLSDSGVSYNLFNPDHPSGSTHYGEAIENLPQVEATTQVQYSLRNKLLTLKNLYYMVHKFQAIMFKVMSTQLLRSLIFLLLINPGL